MFDILPLILIFLFIIHGAWAGVNQTIDNSDPGILYQPFNKWKTYEDASCSSGSYAMGHDSCANATIQCNWISFYYSAPLWPYPISTTISIDGNDPVVVDLQDYNANVSPGGSSTVPSKVVYSYTGGTTSELHTILISGSAQFPFAMVDSLIFETTDGTGCSGYRPCPSGSTNCINYATATITVTGTFTTTTTTTTTTSAPLTVTKTHTTTTTTTVASGNDTSGTVIYYKHKNKGLKIGVAILAACLGLLLLLLCFLLWRRYKHRHQHPVKPVVPVYGGGGSPHGSPHGSHSSLNRHGGPGYGASAGAGAGP